MVTYLQPEVRRFKSYRQILDDVLSKLVLHWRKEEEIKVVRLVTKTIKENIKEIKS